MLNTFPELLSYSPLAPFVLRIVVGFILLDLGLLKLKKERPRWVESLEALHLPQPHTLLTALGVTEIIGALMLLVGIYTQIAALVFLILAGVELYVETTNANILKRDFVFYLLIGTIALSLLFTGAGAFAFDIPL